MVGIVSLATIGCGEVASLSIDSGSGDSGSGSAEPRSFSVAYASTILIRQSTSTDVPRGGLVINTGPDGLRVDQMTVLSASDDHPQAVFALNILTPGTVSAARAEAHGFVSAAASGVITPLLKTAETWNHMASPTIDVSLTNLPSNDVDIKATATLRIGNQIVDLDYVFQVRGMPPAGTTVVSGNRVDSRLE